MNPGGFSERIWRSRWRRAAALPLVFALLATNIPPGPRPGMAGPGEADLSFTPVQLAGLFDKD